MRPANSHYQISRANNPLTGDHPSAIARSLLVLARYSPHVGGSTAMQVTAVHSDNSAFAANVVMILHLQPPSRENRRSRPSIPAAASSTGGGTPDLSDNGQAALSEL
ncbi:hypothetical protein FALBO_12510 [Fusarium albosuccineum]|uniref:Uncharacterized protein n=1 Tax=Fusarium albosuccineum TaxID=1237068 RepID=A0A8H4L098_9HYPO|nr:hypothetical protein FALBO_12510 [Fusarium albosuccineum]